MDLLLCGDVMTGRGIDQVLPGPLNPRIYESFLDSALEYAELAEQRSGRIARPVDFAYIWGEALTEIAARAPDVRLVNLETSVTTSEDPAPKGINYRMSPENVPCLLVPPIDCCVLANNHVLDWGTAGLLETVQALARHGIATAGAGKDLEEATGPARLETPSGRRVLVFAFSSTDSGIPLGWAATATRPGVSLLSDLSERSAGRIESQIRRHRRPGDFVIVSIHWGSNWGYAVPAPHRRFAHRLIDTGMVDTVHGHSSHHPRGIEVYRDRPILYGCGDFISDYEGISGHESYRPELVLAYFLGLSDETKQLERLEMAVFRSRRLRLERAGEEEAGWVGRVLNAEGAKMGTSVDLTEKGILSLRW
jgi:poly-gamma-glutamate synthesis protein (capsule biosynthesis protein)